MKKLLFLMLAIMPMLFMSCSSDDEDVPSISKSELIGTWYSLQDRWVLVFSETKATKYELWGSAGTYKLNPYVLTSSYFINGNQIYDENGGDGTISIVGETLKMTTYGTTLTFKKFDGTPMQLIEFLNRRN